MRVVAALAHLDERYPVLHQLAGEEAAAAEFAVAVKVAVLLPLGVDFENLAGLLQSPSALVRFAVHAADVRFVLGGEAALEERPQLVAAGFQRRLHPRAGERRQAPFRPDVERLVLRPEKPA